MSISTTIVITATSTITIIITVAMSTMKNLKRENCHRYEADHQGVEHHRLVELQVPEIEVKVIIFFLFVFLRMNCKIPNGEHNSQMD